MIEGSHSLVPLCLSALLIAFVGCLDHDFQEYPDASTATVFMGERPTCEELEAWRTVHEAASSVWGVDVPPMHVWIVRDPGQLVYYRGEVRTLWPSFRGLAWWGASTASHLYLSTYFWPECTVRLITLTMVHELTHAYWRIPDHTDEFYQHLMDLLDALGLAPP